VQALDCPVARGNHDEGAANESMLEDLNPLAQTASPWTCEQLNREQRRWLAELKLVRQVRDFTIVHATLDSPGGWTYVTNRFDAMASFSYQFTQLCFYGHTHAPRIFEKDDTVRLSSRAGGPDRARHRVFRECRQCRPATRRRLACRVCHL